MEVNKVEFLNVNDIRPHEKNDYFFDDMSGTKWDEFKQSIKTSGVISPIVITQDGVIVSGTQRRRACIELGIDKVPCIRKTYTKDSDVIKDLIETNIRQRGSIDCGAVKMGHIINALEEIYGISPNKKESETGVKREDLCEMLDINKESYRLLKKLTELAPEIQQEVESGNISASTASRIVAKLPKEMQSVLHDALPKDVKLSSADVQEYINRLLEEKENSINDMVQMVTDANNELIERDKEIKEARLEAEAYKRKLEAKESEVAGEFIRARDNAEETARRATERAVDIAAKERKTSKEVERLRGELLHMQQSRQESSANIVGATNLLDLLENTNAAISTCAKDALYLPPDVRAEVERRTRSLMSTAGFMLESFTSKQMVSRA